MIRPFIRWAGGKQNLIHEILAHCPDDNLINRYFEPFLGAGSLFFANGFENAFISDINSQLINAYKKIRSDSEKVHALLKVYEAEFLNNHQFYYVLRKEYNNNFFANDIEQAARFIFLLHTNYNGMYRINLAGEYNVPIGKLKPSLPSLEHLNKISEKLKGKSIKAISYKKILNQVGENDFVYIDPPYAPINWSNQFQQFTIDKFSKGDQEELAAFAYELDARNCFVMISNANVEFIRQLYVGWEKIKLKTIRWVSCKSREKITELIIKNY